MHNTATESHFPRFSVVFDVESVGLQGEPFAVAWVVLDMDEHLEIEAAVHACDSELATGDDSDRRWVAENVPAFDVNCADPAAVRATFSGAWQRWRSLDAWLVADCALPVETNFLSACVRDVGAIAKFAGPYPLLDIATYEALAGVDPPSSAERLPDETPRHHPPSDARCMARRLLRVCLRALNARGDSPDGSKV